MMSDEARETALGRFLLVLLTAAIVCILFAGVTLTVGLFERTEKICEEEEPHEELPPSSHTLTLTADAGISYQDRLTFFGESTTAHLKSRGVLTGGTETKQVWRDASNTKKLDAKLLSQTIINPETGESQTVEQVAAANRPAYLVLSFGLNGITEFINNKDKFLNNYRRLIAAVLAASPDTKIILQSTYPVSENEVFSVDSATLNGWIDTLNGWVADLADESGSTRFVDTASVLKNEDGQLDAAYDTGDGIHLTAEAYRKILLCLRTHAWQ